MGEPEMWRRGGAKTLIGKIGRCSLWGVRVVIVVSAFYLSVVFLPYPLFPYHLEHAGFSVYSDRALCADFESVLEDARRRVEVLELFRGQTPPRTFACQPQRLFVLFDRWAGKRHTGQGLLISVSGNAFFRVGRRDCRAAITRSTTALETRWAVVRGDRARGRAPPHDVRARISSGPHNARLEIGGLCG
jgi:hypothetical protein